MDELLAAEDLQPAETVANTIFPAAIAATSRDHLELTRRYLAMLPTLRRLSPGNARGTYFGRLVAFPGPDGPVNQLDAVITRLRRETAKKGSGTGPLTACYEAGFTAPGTDIPIAVPERLPRWQCRSGHQAGTTAPRLPVPEPLLVPARPLGNPPRHGALPEPPDGRASLRQLPRA